MQGATTAKQARNGDRGAAKTTADGKGGDAAGAKVGADAVKSDAGANKAGDIGNKQGDATGNKAGAMHHHGLSAVEAKDSQTIVAPQSPVTVMRPVRGDLEEHIPKPRECAHFFFIDEAYNSFKVRTVCLTN